MFDTSFVIRMHPNSPVDGATLACTWRASWLRYAGGACGLAGNLKPA